VPAVRAAGVAEVRRRLRRAAVPSRFDSKAYLGSPLPVLGVSAPAQEAIARELLRGPPPLSAGAARRLAAALWKGRFFEERIVAILLLSGHRETLGDSAWKMMDRWVDSATGWGLSDSLAGGPISAMVATSAPRMAEVLRWTRSENPWRRRAALYALNRRIRDGRLREPFRVIDRLREDPEFWVQRAVGTWLRECWKKDEPLVRRYLRRHAARLPPVTLTVATERAPPSFRSSLRARARRARRSRRGRAPERGTIPPRRPRPPGR